MIEELNRRLSAVGGYIDGVHQRAERNMPPDGPPFPNRYHRRKLIEKKIEENVFNINLKELHESVPRTFVGPEFIRQLYEAQNSEDEELDVPNFPCVKLDRTEYVTVQAMRTNEAARQKL